MTKKFHRHVFVPIFVFLFVLVSGCASGFTSGQKLNLPDSTSPISFFVERSEKDGRNLALAIAENLTDRGYEVTQGEVDTTPEDVDYVIRYIDHWVWDGRMYLADLRIEVRDPATGAIVAYGQSIQNSLKALGKSHNSIIENAISEVLDSTETDEG